MPNEDGRKILPEKAEEKCIPSPHVKHHSRHSTSDHDGGIPPPQSRPPVMLRILCLHDGHSNADELSDRLEILGDGLYHNHGIELVYVNAPLLVSSRKPKQHDEEGGDNDYEDEKSKDDFDTNPLSQIPKRVWWEEDEGKEDVVDSQGSEHSKLGEQVKASEDLVETTTTTTITSTEEEATPLRKYVGLDASLLLVRQVWSSMPFWGIIGVGTGAAVASFLPLLPMTRSSAPPPQFMICIRGETILEETELLVDADLSRSCLHLWDEEENEDYDDDGRGNDGDIPSSSSPRKSPSSKERLWRQLGGKIVTGWSHGCLSTRALNLMGKFIVEQKKSLRTTNTEGGNILVLQNQLFLAEQEAATMVAQRIALDPPKALMAVISPQRVVGGWMGGKRRAPDEEGGGAPCPSEFLLRRDKRTTDPHGPTRDHPKNDYHHHERPTSDDSKARNEGASKA